MKFQVRQLMKKGQIGPTITWFVAFIVIFFMTSMFVLGASALAGKRLSGDWLKIFGSSDAEDNKWIFKQQSEAILLELLNRRLDFSGDKIFLRDLIVSREIDDGYVRSGDEAIIKKEIGKILTDKGITITDQCYMLYTDTKNFNIINMGYSSSSFFLIPIPKTQKELSKKVGDVIAEENIFLEGKIVKLKFYAGPCSIL